MAGQNEGLTKASINILDGTNEYIPVLFNPSEYSISKSVNYADSRSIGGDEAITSFASGSSATMKMTLYFDGHIEPDADGKPKDVNDWIAVMYTLVEIDGELHMPPRCEFEWGSISFEGVVTDMEISYTMFDSEGKPLRAKMDVTFKHSVDVDASAHGTPLFSPDRSKMRVMHQNVNLYQIADEEYGSCGLWREIARANKIANPRKVEMGQALRVPAI